jgi:hypothetical protein
MSKYSGSGWHYQSVRHSRARKYGKAGGTYVSKWVGKRPIQTVLDKKAGVIIVPLYYSVDKKGKINFYDKESMQEEFDGVIEKLVKQKKHYGKMLTKKQIKDLNKMNVNLVYKSPNQKWWVFKITGRKGEGLFEFERRKHFIVTDKKGKEVLSTDSLKQALTFAGD